MRQLFSTVTLLIVSSLALADGMYSDLFYIDTTGLWGLDLLSGESTRIHEKLGQPEGITTVGSSEVVFSFREHRVEHASLYYFDANEKMIGYLGSGSNPVYLQSRQELVFFDKSPTGYGLALYVATIGTSKQLTEKKILMRGPFTSGTAPLIISDRVIIVLDSRNTTWMVDLESQEKLRMNEFLDCIPQVVVGKNILCADDLFAFRLINLGGGACDYENIGYAGFPILYIPNIEAILFLKEATDKVGEKTYRLHLLDTEKNEDTLVNSNAIFSRGNASLANLRR